MQTSPLASALELLGLELQGPPMRISGRILSTQTLSPLPLAAEQKRLHGSKDVEEAFQQGSNRNKYIFILFPERKAAKCLKGEGKML